MSIWDDLSDDELYLILECNKLRHVMTTFKKKIAPEQWITAARAYYHAEYNHNIMSTSIFSAMNDAPSYSLMTLLSIVGTVSLKFFALTFLTTGFAAVMLMTGLIFFAASYVEQRDKNRKDQEFFDFAVIKIQCAEEIIRRHKKNLQHDSHQDTCHLYTSPEIEADVSKPFVYQNKSKLDKIKPALGAGLLTATMAFGTYYLGVAGIIAAFGASAAAAFMLGPIGLGVAIGAAVAIGIYCGVRQYQMCVQEHKIQKQQKHMDQYFHFKRNQCYELQTLMHNNSRDHDMEPALLHKNTLPNSASRERDFLMRQNALLRKKTAKPMPADPIIPSPGNPFKTRDNIRKSR